MNEPLHLEFRVDSELEGGVYANVLSVWHTQHEFTLDFATTLPTPGDGTQPVRLTSRVKLPPTVVFHVLRALNENLTAYEQTHGPISGPATPTLYPPQPPTGNGPVF